MVRGIRAGDEIHGAGALAAMAIMSVVDRALVALPAHIRIVAGIPLRRATIAQPIIFRIQLGQIARHMPHATQENTNRLWDLLHTTPNAPRVNKENSQPPAQSQLVSRVWQENFNQPKVKTSVILVHLEHIRVQDMEAAVLVLLANMQNQVQLGVMIALLAPMPQPEFQVVRRAPLENIPPQPQVHALNAPLANSLMWELLRVKFALKDLGQEMRPNLVTSVPQVSMEPILE